MPNWVMEQYIEANKILTPEQFRKWKNATGMWIAPYATTAEDWKGRLMPTRPCFVKNHRHGMLATWRVGDTAFSCDACLSTCINNMLKSHKVTEVTVSAISIVVRTDD